MWINEWKNYDHFSGFFFVSFNIILIYVCLQLQSPIARIHFSQFYWYALEKKIYIVL